MNIQLLQKQKYILANHLFHFIIVWFQDIQDIYIKKKKQLQEFININMNGSFQEEYTI